jgi:hypothetical protein
VIAFFVAGYPRTKGSLQPFKRQDGSVGVREHNDFELRVWRTKVKKGAQDAMVAAGRAMFTSSVYLGLNFYFEGGAPIFGQRMYDLDKLTRAVMDALTDAQAYRDDSQVTKLIASKAIMGPASGGRAGVAICLDLDGAA